MNKQLGHFSVKLNMNNSHLRQDCGAVKVERKHANICEWGGHENR